MGMSHFSYIGLPQMGPTFITDEFFITPGMGRGCKKHHKIKGTRNYYFKTTGYLKRVLCNPALGTNAWFKMLLPMPGTLSRLGPSYYTCAFYRRCPFNHGACLNEQNLGKN